MPKRRNSPDVARRNFLKSAGLVGAAALTPAAATAQIAAPRAELQKALPPGPKQIALETQPPGKDPVTQTSSGGDFMVDVIKSLGIEYAVINCASSYRGIHESLINYGKNTMPELITCPHEEIAVHMAQGFAKIDGKPLVMMCHGVVGLQHASMALYNSWCDRVPVMVMIGNITEADKRAPGAEWLHSALDPAAIVRDFLKWDDQPQSLQHYAESTVRAYKLATTPPMAPVLISLDAELQENPIADRESLRIPKVGKVVPPQADSGAIAELAKMLVAADNPVLICDRLARTPDGMKHLVELAETLQCGVVDLGGRMNFPSRHPLNQSFRRAAVDQADVIVGLELNDFWGSVNSFTDRIVRTSHPTAKPGAKMVSLGTRDYLIKSNFQDFARYQDVDLAIGGDGEASLPELTEAVKRLIDPSRKSAYEARGKKLAAAQLASLEQARAAATTGWDASPISVARLSMEVYNTVKDEDWSLVGTSTGNNWPRRLWDFKTPYSWNGGSGGGGIGYTLPASLGAALANKKHGRLTVAIGGDGDFNFAPGTLWTAAHHRIPMLYVVLNNHAYHQEYMYVLAMAGRRNRGVTDVDIGTTLKDPNIDYATVARGFGVHGEGPISDPAELGPALQRALAVVKSGQPALVDVVSEPR
ncbi:MAG TPA: thiamine pyrophosphate-dependent enzyme [Xanthobacteraceae bacterium]|nr:thiamine pyrophosphate-dependent enzyme [Xanthobacteraceae bacterium]